MQNSILKFEKKNLKTLDSQKCKKNSKEHQNSADNKFFEPTLLTHITKI